MVLRRQEETESEGAGFYLDEEESSLQRISSSEGGDLMSETTEIKWKLREALTKHPLTCRVWPQRGA